MLTSHSTGGFATTSAPEGFDLQDFEEAGLRAVERRFGPRDTIFTPGDPDDQLYFLLSGTVRLYKIYGDYKEASTFRRLRKELGDARRPLHYLAIPPSMFATVTEGLAASGWHTAAM